MHIDCLMNLSSMNMQKITRLKRLLSTKYYRGGGNGMKKLEHTFEIMNFSSFFLRIFGVVVIFKLSYKLKCFFKTMSCFLCAVIVLLDLNCIYDHYIKHECTN